MLLVAKPAGPRYGYVSSDLGQMRGPARGRVAEQWLTRPRFGYVPPSKIREAPRLIVWFAKKVIVSSAGTAPLKKNPCPCSHPVASRDARCSDPSTPSATTARPKPCPKP